MRVHRGKALVAGIAVLALALAACSSSKSSGKQDKGTQGSGKLSDCATKPLDCNAGKTKKGGSFTYTIEKVISGWNLNSTESNTFDFAEVLDGLLPGVYIGTPDLKATLNPDLMVSAEQTSASPQTLVYKIKPEAVWNDGSPVNVDDFKYAWKTQNGVDCTPKFDKDGNAIPGQGCPAASTSGYDQVASITGSDNGKTVTVVMKKPYTDWKIMFGGLYPAHIAAQHGGVDGYAGLSKSFLWLDQNRPTYSAGPYLITGYTKDTSVTETPNPKWYGKVKPSLDRLIFRIITDQTQEVPALQNNEVQAIYPQPNQDIVSAVKGLQGVDSYLGTGLSWEHFDFNEKNPILADKVLRTAIFTAVDVKQIIAKTIGQFVQGAKPLGSHMYKPGQDGYADNVTATGQGSGAVAKAKEMLTSAGYSGVGSALKNKSGKPVNIRCSFTTGNVLRQQTCVLLQSQLSALGIKVTPTPIDKLGGTLSSGNYDLIIFAWVGTPFVFADAQGIWVSTAGGNYGHNINPTVDKDLNAAASSTDPAKAKDLTNQADIALTSDAYVLPLFLKPTYLASYANMVNVRDNATSTGPPYNVQEWGQRAS